MTTEGSSEHADPTPAPGPVTVGFIGATGRSGSTLLARVLGGAATTCSVGELCWIWNYGLLANRDCGCGEPFLSCPFWLAVGERAFGGWDHLDATALNQTRRDLVSTRKVPSLWRRGADADPRLPGYLQTWSALYRGIADVSGAQVVIDNSKQVPAALVAALAPGVDLRLVHLVRSVHGVAYSWTKHVPRADMGGKEMRRRSPGRTALRWSADNIMFERLGARGLPRLAVRYDDFVADARASTIRILDFLGVPDPDPAFVGPDWADLGVEHSVWGNPMRGRDGRESIRRDEGWRAGMATRDRVLVSGLAAPAIRRYLG